MGMTDIDSQVHMLQEMGFLKEQSLEALKATGYDVNQAISYLFGEVDNSSGAGTQKSPLVVNEKPPIQNNSINISNPHEIPEFLGLYTSNAAVDEVHHYERPISDSSMNHSRESIVSGEGNYKENFRDSNLALYSSSASSSSLESNLNNPFQDGIKYPENVKTDFTNTPVILSKRRDIKSWVPLLMILAHSSVFAKTVLELDKDVPFIKQLQIIVYFIQNFDQSKRWFQDTDALGEALDQCGPTGFYHDEDMLLSQLSFMTACEPALKPVFDSMVHSLDDDLIKELSVMEIDADARYPLLYESLNELFWQRDFELLGKIKYSSVAPIVIYQLGADGDESFAPLILQEEFYPEIYSDKAVNRVQEEIHAIKRAQMAYQVLNRKLMDLNFFEGKKIDGLLSQTASALGETNPGASEDIQKLAEMLQECRVTEMENQNRSKKDASPQRLTLFEGIIKDMPELRPFKLIGVIFSESRYFIRAKDTWIDMEACVTVGFDSVRSTVERCQGAHLITLIYADAKSNEPLPIEEERGQGEEKMAQADNSRDASEANVPEKSLEIKENSIVSSPETAGGEVTSAAHLRQKDLVTCPRNASTKEVESKETPEVEGEPISESITAEIGTQTNEDEFVKRPKWASSSLSNNVSGDEKKILDGLGSLEPIRVKHHIVRQFLQDENSSSHPA